MKNLNSLSVLLTAILLLICCEKEKPLVDKEFTPDHWPVVKTLEATPLTSSTAILYGSVNACGLSTTVTFDYGTTTNYGSTITADQSPVTGNDIINVIADISGLFLDTTYHFRVKAENYLWKNFYGRDMVFTIHSPKVETLQVTNITETTATLNGNVNTYGLSTPITFEYGTTTSYGHTVTAHQSPATGNSIINVSADISGLTPCTTYHFRVKAENSCGVVYGSDIEFILDNPPIVETLEATNITNTSTKLSGIVNANGLFTTGTFEYGTTTSYGSTITSFQHSVTANIITNVEISGLTPCTTYHFRIKAENSCGIVYGSDKTFICADPIWTNYTTANGLAGYDVQSIAIDAQGNKWFGTDRGVSKFDGTTWTTFDTLGLIDGDAEGNIWFMNSLGVLKFDGTNWTPYTTANGLIYSFTSIAIDAQGNKWFGAEGGVLKFDGTTWTTYTNANSGLLSNDVYAIAIDAQGNKWFGTGGGVSKFDGTTWTNYTTADGLTGDYVRAIAIDAQDNKWFGCPPYNLGDGYYTIRGVSKFDGTTWTTYSPANGLAGNYVYAIAIDAQGNKWFGTGGGGVSKFDGNSWTTYNEENSGLKYNHVRAITIDAQGNKWFGTSGGVSKLSDTCNE